MNRWYLKVLLIICTLPAQAYNIYNQTGEKLLIHDRMDDGMTKTIQPGGMQSCDPSSKGCSGYKYFTITSKKSSDSCTPLLCTWNGYIKGKGNYFIIHQTNVAFGQSGFCYIEMRNEYGNTTSTGKCMKPTGSEPSSCGYDQSG